MPTARLHNDSYRRRAYKAFGHIPLRVPVCAQTGPLCGASEMAGRSSYDANRDVVVSGLRISL